MHPRTFIVKRHFLTALVALPFLINWIGSPSTTFPLEVHAQPAAPDGSGPYHASDRERWRNMFEKRFGKIGELQTLNAKLKFARQVLRTVKRPRHSSIEPYAYRQLRTVLEDHENNPKAIDLLIKTVTRQQRLLGYKQLRQDRLLDLFKKLGQKTDKPWKRANIVRRMLHRLHEDAQDAISEHNWDRAMTNYRRIKGISSSFDQFFHAKSASRMMSRIKKRKGFERKTAKLLESSSDATDQPAQYRKAGRNLLHLGQWSHALLFLQKANQNGLSTPLLDLARIGLTHQISPLNSTDIQFRYLTRIATVLNQSSDNGSFTHPIKTGYHMVRALERKYEDMSSKRKDKIKTVLKNWQRLINEKGPQPFLNMGSTPPFYFLYPREDLVLYAPGNGNTKDFSKHHYQGRARFGALVNKGSGILGAFQFTGAPGRNNNAIRYHQLQKGSIKQEFTIAFRFRRNRDTRGATFRNVGNVMLGLGRRVQIGTSGQLVQIHLQTRNSRSTVRVNGEIKNRTWYHLAITYNPDRSPELQLFLNGTLADHWNVFSGNPIIRPNRIVLGSTSRNRAAFTGLLDDVFVYARSLSEDEIRSLFQRSGTE